MEYVKYKMVEDYMKKCMLDSAHDQEHVYRVLYTALDIASCENDVNYDVLVIACLLHDIARKEQLENPQKCHAQEGAKKAYRYLVANNFDNHFADEVAKCIRCHRYRSSVVADTIEAKILYDADKIDATGTMGIARTLVYIGRIEEPLYSVSKNGKVLTGVNDKIPSFFHEYKYKLEKLYSNFYTTRGREIAIQRQHAAVSFYNNMYEEVEETYKKGNEFLKGIFHE